MCVSGAFTLTAVQLYPSRILISLQLEFIVFVLGRACKIGPSRTKTKENRLARCARVSGLDDCARKIATGLNTGHC